MVVPRRQQLVQLRVENQKADDDSGAQRGVSAGEFSNWLRATEAALRSGGKGTDVPCGSCRGCCRSSMFIQIGPEEVETIRRIPKGLLFPAPGFPRGHVLMGYGDRGQCPMLSDGECSIYEYRPQTCRDYDCRVFAATGLSVDEHNQPEIAHRVAEWSFSYSEQGRALKAALRRAVSFLQDNRDRFPEGSLPGQSGPLAAIAVRICTLFTTADTQIADAGMVRRIVAVLREQRAPMGSGSHFNGLTNKPSPANRSRTTGRR
jgi:Fe-S-cluster containining protein